MRPVLVNRDYTRLWAGQTVSEVGTFVFDTTVLLWVATVIGHGQSWGPLAVGGVVLAEALPFIVVGPVAGVFVDRWDKRRTMLVTDAARAVLVVLLIPVSLAGDALPTPVRLTAVYVTVFGVTVGQQFFGPARLALIGDVVPEDDRARASGISQTSYSLAAIIGPPLAAPLLFAAGVEWSLLLNAASFVVSYLAIRGLRARPVDAPAPAPVADAAGFRREFAEGLSFFRANRTLTALVVSTMIAVLGVGSLNTLDVFFVSENLHARPELYGLLGMALGLGLTAGGILGSAFANRVGVVRTFWMSLLALGFMQLAYSRLTSLAAAVVVLVVFGVANAGVNTAVGPIVLSVTPRELIGRVMAVLMPLLTVATLVSGVLTSVLASTVLRTFSVDVFGLHVGRIDAIFSVAGLLAVLAAGYARASVRLPAPAATPPTAAGVAADTPVDPVPGG